MFGETQSSIVVSAKLDDLSRVIEMARRKGLSAYAIGDVTSLNELRIGIEISLDIESAREAYETSIPLMVENRKLQNV